jgi:transposase
MLLPPDLRDWLDDDHLAWFVIEAVAELDLEPFYAAYRPDRHGAAAHDPTMMVTLFAYTYAVGERSSRGIERRCRQDVAFRVICANQVPDHATIARFRVRHEEALAGPVAAEILAEAGRIDAAEDEIHGDARGDELPDGLRTPNGRRAWLREAEEESRARASRAPGAGAARSRPAARDLPPRGAARGPIQALCFSFRQPPARLLAMISLNIAPRALALIVSPSRTATVRAALLSWPPVMIPSGSGTIAPS